MAVSNSEHRSRVAPPRIVAGKRLVNVLLRQVEPPLLDLNRRIRELRPCPQQAAKVGAANAQFGRGLADIAQHKKVRKPPFSRLTFRSADSPMCALSVSHSQRG